jgi:hypothetical protein
MYYQMGIELTTYTFEAGIRNQHDGQLTATVSDEHNTELEDYMLIHFPNLKTDVELRRI